MSFFGWRLTNKSPVTEAEAVKKLSSQLDVEHKFRHKQAIEHKQETAKLKEELKEAKAAEEKRLIDQRERNRGQAIIHLEVAERYQESMEQSEGARKSSLRALIDKRLEKAANLGFPIKGDITRAILDIS